MIGDNHFLSRHGDQSLRFVSFAIRYNRSLTIFFRLSLETDEYIQTDALEKQSAMGIVGRGYVCGSVQKHLCLSFGHG